MYYISDQSTFKIIFEQYGALTSKLGTPNDRLCEPSS